MISKLQPWVRLTALLSLLWMACHPIRAEEHWSLRPLEVSSPPKSEHQDWAQTPIDLFILQKLTSEGMHPSARASKPVLLRRVYYNLTGLPPTPEELDRFVADRSPEAFARVVDRLLDRPDYGERWARHWLDVAHYAESHGHDQDRVRTNAWPYRDYVIASFNSDKPYARFVQEQIAGDALFPGDPQAVVAMGFLATGPWDESSLRDIREDTIDRQIARYVDRDDIVATVMNTFASTTVQCARCHDHKFDPVSQSEYYSLQAVFAGTEKANRLYDNDRQVHGKRQALLAWQEELDFPDDKTRATLLGESFKTKVEAWEAGVRKQSVLWTMLAPESASSSNGSTLTPRADNSVYAEGERPEKDTYIVAATAPEPFTAVRLEVLREASLSTGGPGRADNGNFHLTDFHLVSVAPDGSERTVRFKSAVADFDQEGWGVEKAIDNDPKTGWGVFPAIGKTHAAVFALDEILPAGSRLKFVLAQNHGGSHLLKRVRLSASLTDRTGQIRVFSEDLARVITAPEKQRSEADRVLLASFVAREQLTADFAALPRPSMVYAGARYFVPDGPHKPSRKPRPVHLLKRGDIHKPAERARPAALKFQAHLPGNFELGEDSEETDRRAALARWLTDPRNGLAWRSIVNRVWHYHFGRGLVGTPSDFGKMGETPSHPELLDWLANWFIENGGSFKELHRLILNSAVYQQSSADHPEFAARDAGNRLLWRMNRSRLDAEAARDSVLIMSGTLRRQMGGPSDQQFILTPGIHVTPNADYAAFDIDSATARRRGIYRFVFRTLPDPLMDALDCPDSSQLTPVRHNSITVAQALALWNDRFTLRYSEHFAERLRSETSDVEAQVRLAGKLVFSRELRPEETGQFAAFVRDQGLASFCRVLFNSNEFMFVN